MVARMKEFVIPQMTPCRVILAADGDSFFTIKPVFFEEQRDFGTFQCNEESGRKGAHVYAGAFHPMPL